MASGITNKGKARILEVAFRQQYNGGAEPTHYYVALVTSDNVPDADTNVLSDLTEITAGNGYTADGYELSPGTTDFDSILENNTDDRGEIEIKDVSWTASGGDIPSAGNDAHYAVLTDDSVDPEILAWWDLGADISIGNGNTLKLQDLTLRLDAP